MNKIIFKTIQYHFTPIRVAVKKKERITNVSKDIEKLEPLCIHCWWNRKVNQPLRKTVELILKILHIE